MADAAATADTPPWMILDRLTTIRPLIVYGLEPDNFDMKLSYQTPPLRTVLSVRAAVCPDPLYVASIESNGTFILSARAEEGGLGDPELYYCSSTVGWVTRLPLADPRSTLGVGDEGSMGQDVGDGQRFVGVALDERDFGVVDAVARYGNAEEPAMAVAEHLGVVHEDGNAEDLAIAVAEHLGMVDEDGNAEERAMAVAEHLGVVEEDGNAQERVMAVAEHLGVDKAAQDVGPRVIGEHVGVVDEDGNAERIIDDLPRVQNIGVIPARNGNYLIVELRQARGAGKIHTRLLCLMPMHAILKADQWVEKELEYPRQARPWHGDGTICHQNKMWWFSLGHGLLTCDPFADKPELRYFPLPSGCEIDGNLDLSKRRCLNVSAQGLWFVVLEGHGRNMVITTWQFSGESSTMPWTPGYELPVLEMWEDRSYKGLGLERAEPQIVFVHPTIPEVIYLLEGSWIFSVDLSSGMVVPIVQISSEEKVSIDELSAQKRFLAWQLNWRPWITLACATWCDPAYKDCIVLGRRQTPRPSQFIHGPSCLERKPEYVYVAATEPSGLILLCAGYYKQGRPVLQKVYFLMDHKATPKPAPGRGICRLPDQNQNALCHGNLGVISKNGKTYVAEIQLVPSRGGGAIVHIWSSTDPGKWSRKQVNNPLSNGLVWNGNGVIGWNDNLWWVDLSQGLMCYNLFAEHSQVRFLALPTSSKIAAEEVSGSIVERRFVNVSEGYLRYAELHGPNDAPVVSVWTVIVNQRKKMSWRHEYNLNLKEVWSSSWFKSTALSAEVPILALMNPLDHHILYFVQETKMFTVDVRSPLVNRYEIAKFKIEGSAGDCKSGLVLSYVTPIETMVLVPKL